jgi:uncharacterized protein YllA (UPF0747 family)
LKTRQLKALTVLEKKMLRAEKRKFVNQKNQIDKLFSALCPDEGLQERTDNFMLFYSRFGKDLFKVLLDNSLTTEQKFCILTARKN